MILRCRFGDGMNDSSATFHAQNEISDLHHDRGFHRERSLGYESGRLVPTLLPNFAAEIDGLNGWFDQDEIRSGGGFEQAGATLKRLVLWACQADSNNRRHISSIGRRTIALGFAIAPGEVGWQSMEAAAKELGCTKQSFSKYTREILELANGRFQRSCTFRGPKARAARSAASIRQWDKLGRLSIEEKNRKRRETRQPKLSARRAAYAARQAKLSRKNTLQTPKTP